MQDGIGVICYRSTNQPLGPGGSAGVSFREALLRGIAPDGGLFLPDPIPALGPADMRTFHALSYASIAARVLAPFTSSDLDVDALEAICRDAYDFEVPVEPAAPGLYVMRLDQGPTASFKDFAARWMARAMDRLLPPGERRIVLVATSGDTGSAVGAAFQGLERFRVLLLYPAGEVSEVQRRQMDTLGGNVAAVQVEGTFDDCQRMAKEAFLDPALAGLRLTSANSINVGRILPQAVYYVYAWSRVCGGGGPVSFSVPSGNFGNSFGCVVARAMGLPVRRLVLAVNENDAFPHFLETGEYRPVAPSRACLSNAMNVGNPSNLARYFALYGGMLTRDGGVARAPDVDAMRQELLSVSVTDAQTRAAMREACARHRVVLEPHGAVAYAALRLLGAFPARGRRMTIFRSGLGPAPGTPQIPAKEWADHPIVLLETAHPAKFPEVVEEELGIVPDPPPSLAGLRHGAAEPVRMPAEYAALKEMLLSLGRGGSG